MLRGSENMVPLSYRKDKQLKCRGYRGFRGNCTLTASLNLGGTIYNLKRP